MQPLWTKKSPATSYDKKNHATSQDAKKNHAASQDITMQKESNKVMVRTFGLVLVCMVWLSVLFGNQSFKIPSSILDFTNLSDMGFLLVFSVGPLYSLV